MPTQVSRHTLYDQSPEGRAVRARYRLTKAPAVNARYRLSPEGRTIKKLYNQSSKGRALTEQYRVTVKGILARERTELNVRIREHTSRLAELTAELEALNG